MLPTSAIDSGDQLDTVAEIDMNFGGAFLADSDVDKQDLPALLHFFGRLVEFGSRDKKHTPWKVDGPVYRAIP